MGIPQIFYTIEEEHLGYNPIKRIWNFMIGNRSREVTYIKCW
jgi:hypothetical protein